MATLLEEIYNELLLEAKSEEEIKKILEYQFVQGKGVPQEVLDKIFSIDPTKKKTYTKWVLIQWEKYHNEITQDINSGRLAEMFNYFKSRAGDGLNLVSCENYEEAIKMLPYSDPIFKEEEGGDKNPANDFEVVFESPEWKIAVPHTFEADSKLGQGCRWCTAGAFGNGESWWNKYSKVGPLWINYDLRKGETCPMDAKEYPYTRYQFLFEWDRWTGEIKDSNDDDVYFYDIDIPEDVIEFYSKQNSKYGDIIRSGSMSEEERETVYLDARNEASIGVIYYDDHELRLLPEWNEDYDTDFEHSSWYMYGDYETIDSLGYRCYDPDDSFMEFSFDDGGESYLCICRDVRGILTAYYLKEGGWAYDDISNYFIVKNSNGTAISYTSNSILVIMGDSEDKPHHVIRLTDSDNYRNSEIEDVILNTNINTSNMEGWDGIENWYEIVWKNGAHSLLWVGYGEDEYDFIIDASKPLNGEYFTFVEYGDQGYIETSTGKRWFNDVPEGEDDDFYEIIKDYGDFSLVNVSAGGVNVLRKEDNKMLFPFKSYHIDLINLRGDKCFFIHTYNENRIAQFYFYSIPKNIMNGPYNWAETKEIHSTYAGFVDINHGAGLYDYNTGRIYDFGEYAKEFKALLSKDNIYLVKTNEDFLDIIEIENGQIIKKDLLPKGYYLYGFVGGNVSNHVGYILVSERGGQNCVLWDFINQKILGHMPNPNQGQLLASFWSVAYHIIAIDGGLNILGPDGLMLDSDFSATIDDISRVSGGKFAIIKSQSRSIAYILDIKNKEIFPQNGISIADANIKPSWGDNKIYIDSVEHGVTIYDLETNEMESTREPDGRQFFLNLIHPEARQVSESFNNLFKRISNYGKNH